MKRPGTWAGLAMWAVLAVLPAIARADGDEGAGSQSLLARLNYSVSGGMMDGISTQGRSLRRGPFGSFNVRGESATGMQLGIEATYVASQDDYHTHFMSLGGIARLSPTPEDYRVFIQLGAAIYHVTFNSKEPGALPVPNTTRPGGSFGIGLDVYQGEHFNLGALAMYNGVVMARTSARSYLTAGINLTFKPSTY